MTAPTAPLALRRLTGSTTRRDLAVTLAAFGLTLALLAGIHGATRGLDPLGVALAVVATFPLLVHRRSPLGVFVLTTLASATLNGLGYGLGPPFGPTAALFYVALDDGSHLRMRRTAGVVLGLFALHVGSTVIPHHSFPTTPILAGIVVWGGAWVIGDQLRARRHRRADLLERARRSERDTERERRLAAAEERTRIARDLHDSAAHAINVILVQAGAARLLQREDPAAATQALTVIEDVARETIGEIDGLVRVLREGGRAVPATVEPPVGLAALETLVERYRAAGLAVDVRYAGRRRPLPPGIDQAAYRILQESLTNAARHGDGAAEVEIAFRPDGLELAVANPAPAAAAGPEDGGHGILGMRERAALLAGSLEAGRSDGHFRVEARLPYAGAVER